MNMTIQKLPIALAAAVLAISPIAAQAAPRASAPVTEESEMAGNGLVWFGIAAAIAVVVLAVIAATDDDDDSISA
ncbi:hypothetical protein C0V74_01935 [Altererythrobacter sp. TH136]|nr:hypothetical protein C0V74_01935 [Altererythrobacter sp. TH136]